MKRVDVLSGLWLLLAVSVTAWLGLQRADAKQAPRIVEHESLAASAQYATLPNGERAVVDANGVPVPVRRYTRVASTSTIGDALALALLEPERVLALSDYGKRHHDEAHRYGQRLPVVGPQQLEQLVERGVDLLITNHLGSQAELARMREAGLQVFNFGDMRGLTTLLPNIAAFAALVGEPARGELYATKLVRRLRAVASDIPASKRKTAVYVSTYANQLFGGAAGTSYHDVLVHAGLRDVASERHSGWVHYDPEQLLDLNPEIVVANRGTGEALCLVGGLENLRACRNGRVVTIDMDLLNDPGPRMLEAAEALRERVYGPVD